jgi:cytochrome P450
LRSVRERYPASRVRIFTPAEAAKATSVKARRLPPGPRSRTVATALWLARPIDLLESCRKTYGDTFTLSLLGGGRNVIVSDPAAIKEIFSRDKRGPITSAIAG